LPHLEAGNKPQFITWRTEDSIPIAVLEAWKAELAGKTDSERGAELARRTEKYCDECHGECLLRDPRAARKVQEVLLYDHMLKYTLHAWVVMPNHVHVLLTPNPDVKLFSIMRRLKTVSSTAVNRLFGRSGQFWQIDYFDRMQRDSEHFARTKHYIEWNPVKAKLCTDPSMWTWSSRSPKSLARLEFLVREKEESKKPEAD